MSTSVKLRLKAKARLEELQARLRLHGIKASLQDILEKLIELGFEEEEKVLAKFKREQVVGEDPMLKLLEKPLDWGIKDSSLRIDEVLYGESLDSIHRHKHIRSCKKQERY